MIDKFDGKYRWLSNFWPCNVKLDNAVYPSVEHAYQAAKTVSAVERGYLLKPGLTAAGAKKIGQKISIRGDWESVKIPIMSELVWQKFQLPALQTALLDTGDEELVEGNWWGDTFWGICKGEGRNELGKILMEIRAELRRESRPSD